MATRGYDDTKAIAEIMALMEASPGMSRKAAIRQVVGEGSVRRVEMKMSRRAFKAVEEAAEGEVSIQTGSNPTEMMLVTAERQALAGTGEKVRWASFNDTAAIEGRLKAELLGPDHAEREERLDRFCLNSVSFAVTFGLVMFSMLPFGLFGKLIGVPDDQIKEAVSPVVAVCLTGMVASVLSAVFFGLRAERMTAPFDRRAAADPIAPSETRRYVLTDKALYAFRPDGDAVRIQRVEVSSVTGVDTDGEGDLVIRSRQCDVTLRAVRNRDEVLPHLTFACPDAASA